MSAHLDAVYANLKEGLREVREKTQKNQVRSGFWSYHRLARTGLSREEVYALADKTMEADPSLWKDIVVEFTF